MRDCRTEHQRDPLKRRQKTFQGFSDIALLCRCGAVLQASVPAADIQAEAEFLKDVSALPLEDQRTLWHWTCEHAGDFLEPDEMPRGCRP